MSTYLSRQIFDHALELQDPFKLSWTYDRKEFSAVGDVVEMSPTQLSTKRQLTGELRLYTPAEIKAFEDFVAAHKGELIGFWMPNLSAAAFSITAGADATNFDVVASNHAEEFSRLQELHLIFKKDGESDQYAKVSAISDNGDGTERVTITPATGQAIDATWTAFQLLFVRFNSSPKFKFTGEGHARISIDVIEIPSEYSSAIATQSPRYLYEFEAAMDGGTQIWRYTNAKAAITSNAELFSSENITHTGITKTLEVGRGGNTKIRAVYRLNSPWPLFIPFNGSAQMRLKIYEVDASDYDTRTVVFSGFIQSVKFSGKQVDADAQGMINGIAGRYPGRLFEPRCPYKFGDASTCKKDVSGLEKTVTIDSLVDITLTVSGSFSGLGENYFAYGFLKTGTGSQTEIRTILQSSANDAGQIDLVLNAPLRFAVATDSATITPGCGGSYAECTDYSNTQNFGGVPYVPGTNLSIKALEIETSNGNKK